MNGKTQLVEENRIFFNDFAIRKDLNRHQSTNSKAKVVRDYAYRKTPLRE